MKAILGLFFVLASFSINAQVVSADLKQMCLEKVLNSGDPESLMEKTSRNLVISSLKGYIGEEISNVRINHFQFNRFNYEDGLEMWKSSKIEIEGYIKKKNGSIVDFKSIAQGPKYVVQFLRNVFGEVEGCSILISDFQSWHIINAESQLNILTLDKTGPYREMKLNL